MRYSVKLVASILVALASLAFTLTAGGPVRVRQTLCYDWDAATGLCGSTVTISTHPSEMRGQLHRPDTLRQIKGADMGYEALTGRVVDDGSGGHGYGGGGDCNPGDPACDTCKTKFVITGTLTGCDNACVDCRIRSEK